MITMLNGPKDTCLGMDSQSRGGGNGQKGTCLDMDSWRGEGRMGRRAHV